MGVPSPQRVTLGVAAVLRLEELAEHGRDDVARGEVEVVARAVEVDGEEVDAREAVLLPVALEHDEERLLGDAVGGVRLLGVAVPEVVLAERHRRELGVRADGAELDELAEVLRGGVGAARLDELDAHEGVVVEEAAGVEAVGADAPDLRREVDDDVRAGELEEHLDVVGDEEVELGHGRREDDVARNGAQPLDEVAPEEAVAAGDEDSGGCGHWRGLLRGCRKGRMGSGLRSTVCGGSSRT